MIWQTVVAPVAYLLATVAFILCLTLVRQAHRPGRIPLLAAGGLVFSIVGILCERGMSTAWFVVVATLLGGLVLGIVVGRRVDPAVTPARVAFIPASGGAAAALAAVAELLSTTKNGSEIAPLVAAVGLGAAAAVIGFVTATTTSTTVRGTAMAAMTAAFAGWAIALFGVAIENAIFVIVGGLVGAAALSLARVAAKSAARGLPSVLLARPLGAQHGYAQHGYTNVRSCAIDELAVVLKTANTVLLVPGYGMSAARAQHAVEEVSEQLQKRGTTVYYVLHPVAGCLPGHMNIALDEANVAHDRLIDLEAAQALVPRVDVVLVVGANDTINAPASADERSPLFGLPALDLSQAPAVFVIKRSLRAGAAGVRNPQFEQPNNLMLFGDGKRVMQGLVAALKAGGSH
jgi:NAD(P) transhydrogenase subunit beta